MVQRRPFLFIGNWKWRLRGCRLKEREYYVEND
jgi:hypothetical protein